MLVVETVAKIRRAYFVQGKAIKAICRELGVSRKVVRKVLRSGATEFHYERDEQPLPRIGPWQEALDGLLAANEGKAARERLTLIRIFEELRGRGYEGGYDAVLRADLDHRHNEPGVWRLAERIRRRQDDRGPARSPHPPLRHRRDRQRELALQAPRLNAPSTRQPHAAAMDKWPACARLAQRSLRRATYPQLHPLRSTTSAHPPPSAKAPQKGVLFGRR